MAIADEVGSESGEEKEDGDLGVALQEREPELDEPGKFAVVMHNDNYTTMEFVVEVLTVFFRRTEAEAMEIMMQVHRRGRGVAGIYTREIAETKMDQASQAARSRGYPLALSMEPAR